MALFLTGVYFPSIFDTSHTVIWQTIVILFGVLLWIYWANRFAHPPRPPNRPPRWQRGPGSAEKATAAGAGPCR